MKAWLMTWDWTGDAAAVADETVDVLNPRWAVKRLLYAFIWLSNLEL